MRDPYDIGWWIFKQETYESGHTWLADGVIEQYRINSIYKKKTGKLISTKDEHHTFIHCNWGWGGLNMMVILGLKFLIHVILLSRMTLKNFKRMEDIMGTR